MDKCFGGLQCQQHPHVAVRPQLTSDSLADVHDMWGQREGVIKRHFGSWLETRACCYCRQFVCYHEGYDAHFYIEDKKIQFWNHLI